MPCICWLMLEMLEMLARDARSVGIADGFKAGDCGSALSASVHGWFSRGLEVSLLL